MTNSPQLTQTIRQGMDLITHRAFREQARFVKSTGLSLAQFGILMQLHYRQHCAISDISNHMDITSAAASQLVEKLVQSELLERTEDPSDRRAKQVTLSQKGSELIEKSIAERFRWVDDVVATMGADERKKVADALKILSVKVKELDK